MPVLLLCYYYYHHHSWQHNKGCCSDFFGDDSCGARMLVLYCERWWYSSMPPRLRLMVRTKDSDACCWLQLRNKHFCMLWSPHCRSCHDDCEKQRYSLWLTPPHNQNAGTRTPLPWLYFSNSPKSLNARLYVSHSVRCQIGGCASGSHCDSTYCRCLYFRDLDFVTAILPKE
jgi:hypothetical protein